MEKIKSENVKNDGLKKLCNSETPWKNLGTPWKKYYFVIKIVRFKFADLTKKHKNKKTILRFKESN